MTNKIVTIFVNYELREPLITNFFFKLTKIVKIHSPDAILLGTFITNRSFFDLTLTQIKHKFESHFIESGKSRMIKI